MRRRTLGFFIALVLIGSTAFAQSQRRTSIVTGTTLPTRCNIGDLYGLTSGDAGLYVCVGTDTWEKVVSGTGAGNPFDQSLNTTDTPQFAGLGVGTAGVNGQLTFTDLGPGSGSYFLKPDQNILVLRNTDPASGTNFALYGTEIDADHKESVEWSIWPDNHSFPTWTPYKTIAALYSLTNTVEEDHSSSGIGGFVGGEQNLSGMFFGGNWLIERISSGPLFSGSLALYASAPLKWSDADGVDQTPAIYSDNNVLHFNDQWAINPSTGAFYPENGADLGTTDSPVGSGYFGTSVVTPSITAPSNLTIDAAGGANLFIGTTSGASSLVIGDGLMGTTINTGVGLVINGLPTSPAGLVSGQVWLNSNVLTIVP